MRPLRLGRQQAPELRLGRAAEVPLDDPVVAPVLLPGDGDRVRVGVGDGLQGCNSIGI